MLYSTDLFHWHKGVGTLELSDTKGKAEFACGQLYDDACDFGFRVTNPRTGRVEAFYLDRVDKDATGEDVYGWHFLPVKNDLREAGVKILVIND